MGKTSENKLLLNNYTNYLNAKTIEEALYYKRMSKQSVKFWGKYD